MTGHRGGGTGWCKGVLGAMAGCFTLCIPAASGFFVLGRGTHEVTSAVLATGNNIPDTLPTFSIEVNVVVQILLLGCTTSCCCVARILQRDSAILATNKLCKHCLREVLVAEHVILCAEPSHSFKNFEDHVLCRPYDDLFWIVRNMMPSTYGEYSYLTLARAVWRTTDNSAV